MEGKKIAKNYKIIKDLTFLLDLPIQHINTHIIKRIQVQGRGDLIKNIKLPCHVFISFYKYDYQGRYHSHLINVCIRDFNNRSNPQIPAGVYIVLETMKLQEITWVNFQSFQYHGVLGLTHKGCHFKIVVEDIKYKNSDNFQSKKIVSDEHRKQGELLFRKGQYTEAFKRYKKQVNITEGLDKKKYNKQQLQQLQLMNIKAKQNSLRCLIKLSRLDQNQLQIADNYSKQLLKQKNDELSIFLRVHVLLYQRYLSQALDLAKQLQKINDEEGTKLIAVVQERIKRNK